MPNEERIPVYRRGERVDDGGENKTPTPREDGKALRLDPPKSKPARKVKIKKGVVSG